jgi:hypothetical protein
VTSESVRWSALTPDARLLSALDHTDAVQSYDWCNDNGKVDDKRNWSNRFADACASLAAPIVRQGLGSLGAPPDLVVLPTTGGSAEPPVVLGEGSRKRIDVAVVHRLGGLRIDLSFKGLNFRDKRGDHYDKNLTGRTYELEDELRQVRRLQPSSFVFALYWMPLLGATDKLSGESSFARTLMHLRARVHRGAPGTARDPGRLDGAGVALYAPVETALPGGDSVARGVLRCADVHVDPPRRGRPRVEATWTLDELIHDWVRVYLEGVGAAAPDWAEAESELPE